MKVVDGKHNEKGVQEQRGIRAYQGRGWDWKRSRSPFQNAAKGKKSLSNHPKFPHSSSNSMDTEKERSEKQKKILANPGGFEGRCLTRKRKKKCPEKRTIGCNRKT